MRASRSKRAGVTRGRVCVLGLGTVGAPSSAAIAEAGFDVQGYDLDPGKTLGGRGFKVTSDWMEVDECDIYVVCVSTGLSGAAPDMSSVYDACDKIASHAASRRPLVCIESTLSVGTARQLSHLFKGLRLAYVPHRLWPERLSEHGVREHRVIAASDDETLAEALAFYKKVGVPLHRLATFEEAEMTKIVENSFRFVQIAFVEELAALCDEMGLDWRAVREAANTKWNISLPEAREGIYGCLAKDIQYLINASSANRLALTEGAVRTDQFYKSTRAKGQRTKSAKRVLSVVAQARRRY